MFFHSLRHTVIFARHVIHFKILNSHKNNNNNSLTKFCASRGVPHVYKWALYSPYRTLNKVSPRYINTGLKLMDKDIILQLFFTGRKKRISIQEAYLFTTQKIALVMLCRFKYLSANFLIYGRPILRPVVTAYLCKWGTYCTYLSDRFLFMLKIPLDFLRLQISVILTGFKETSYPYTVLRCG